MKRHLLFLLLLVSISVSAQVEHGVLVGGGVGFSMHDNEQLDWDASDLKYNHKLKINGMIGYRFRFLPERTFFYDLDVTVGFQNMNSHKYSPFFAADGNNGYSQNGDDKSFNEFIMPVSVAGSWNIRFSKNCYFGLGVAPTLYARPQAVFDLPVLAKLGCRAGRHCELSLSYQYGCLNTLKHFNNGPAYGRTGRLSDFMFSVYIPFTIK